MSGFADAVSRCVSSVVDERTTPNRGLAIPEHDFPDVEPDSRTRNEDK